MFTLIPKENRIYVDQTECYNRHKFNIFLKEQNEHFESNFIHLRTIKYFRRKFYIIIIPSRLIQHNHNPYHIFSLININSWVILYAITSVNPKHQTITPRAHLFLLFSSQIIIQNLIYKQSFDLIFTPTVIMWFVSFEYWTKRNENPYFGSNA